MGIAPEEMDRLFEAFAQTESGQRARQGTGLGLPISRQFVRLMGGEMTVRSQVGQGTLMEFDMRVEPATAAAIQIRRAPRRAIGLEAGQCAPDGGPYRILIAEDRPESRTLLRELLEAVGLIVREAANGQEAVELYASWRPHLIWMDMRMPVMDSYEASRQIRAADEAFADAPSTDAPSAVIIALTASAFEEDRAAVLAAGCTDFLRKPFREADIFELMAKHLGLRFHYQEVPEAQALEAGGPERDALTAETLATLPADWVADLQEAILDVDLDRVSHLIGQIGERDAPLAETLRKCVDDFEYDRILGLIQSIEGRPMGESG